MENEIIKIETTQLEKVVTESGLAIQEGEEIKKSYLPFLSQLAEIQSQATKINFETPAIIDETIARELRLQTVKIRTKSKELKDERKKGYLLRGNLEQAAYNLIEASCKLTEDVFVNVEKAREFAEKKRKEQLRADRTEKLLPYVPAESMYLYALSEMSDEQFEATFDGLKMAHEKKLAEEKRIEDERLAKIESERKKQADLLAKQKADSDKREADLKAKVEIERKERERLAKELQDKKDIEEKAKQDLLKKLEAEKKAKLAEEKKAAKAPDKVRLTKWVESMLISPLPAEKLSKESIDIANDIFIKFDALKVWAKTQIDLL